ncbi:MAG: hypothetical protein JST52_06485 [Bacteroidetes bacterium]|nr:hypothetical protein [Bacteroidota bacterium]
MSTDAYLRYKYYCLSFLFGAYPAHKENDPSKGVAPSSALTKMGGGIVDSGSNQIATFT